MLKLKQKAMAVILCLILAVLLNGCNSTGSTKSSAGDEKAVVNSGGAVF